MAKEKEVKQSPVSLKKVNKLNLNQKREDFIKDLRGKISKDVGDRETRDEKLERWYKKRYGIRPSNKTFPWPGSSNINIFLTDEKIRRMKPNYVNLAFEGDPVVQFQALGATPLERAQAGELLMDWLLRFKMNQAPGINYFRGLSLAVDRMLEKGKGYVKVVWDYDAHNTTSIIDLNALPAEVQQVLDDPLVTDEDLLGLVFGLTGLNPEIDEDLEQAASLVEQFRNQDTLLKYKNKTVIYNGPRVVPVDDRDLIVPSFTTDIQNCVRITHRIHMTENDLRTAADVGKYDSKAVEKVLDAVTNPTTRATNQTVANTTTLDNIQILKMNREGAGQFQKDTELIEIWEVYTWYDIDGDGVQEKVVITMDPQTMEVLRFIEFPYDHYKWPFVVFDYELNDDRFYSQRGLPEILDHYQTVLTVQENAKLDRMTLANSLQFKYRIGAVNMKNIRFIPGQGIGVHRMEDLQELPIQNLDVSFDQEMTKVRGLAESYIGQPDIAATASDRRTAFEISELTSMGKQVFSFDSRLFKDSLTKLYDQVFELWIQFGPDQVEVRITGSQPIVLTKQDILGNFVIVPSGDFTVLSRTLEVQKAFSELQLALGDTSGAIDQYAAWENYLIKSDPRGSKRILRSREEFQQIQQQQQAAQQQAIEDKKVIAGRKPAQPQIGDAATGLVQSGSLLRGGRSGQGV